MSARRGQPGLEVRGSLGWVLLCDLPGVGRCSSHACSPSRRTVVKKAQKLGYDIDDDGRAVIKLRQALLGTKATGLHELLDELLDERKVERLLGRRVTPKQVIK